MAAHPEVLAIRRHAPVVLACVLIGAVSAGVLVYRTPHKYASNVVMFVAATSTPDGGSANDRALFAQGRVRSYVPLVSSPPVMDRVIRSLQLTDDAAQLASKVTVTAPPDTVLLSITVREDTARLAQLVASETARQFTAFASELEGTDAGRPTVQLTVTRPAQFNPSPVAPRTGLDIWLGAFFGGAVGLTVTALRRRWEMSEVAEVSEVTPAPDPTAEPRAAAVAAPSRLGHPGRIPPARPMKP
ncbi:MAG: tyrosine-protein kinase [Frankiales bacterium]|nr:tyrosine-protein kinase [Frankiales bacterium]